MRHVPTCRLMCAMCYNWLLVCNTCFHSTQYIDIIRLHNITDELGSPHLSTMDRGPQSTRGSVHPARHASRSASEELSLGKSTLFDLGRLLHHLARRFFGGLGFDWSSREQRHFISSGFN